MIFDEEQDQSTGFPDAISDGVFAAVATLILAMVAVMAWAFRAGVLWS